MILITVVWIVPFCPIIATFLGYDISDFNLLQEVKADFLADLQAMGFPEEYARKALQETKSVSLEAAIEYAQLMNSEFTLNLQLLTGPSTSHFTRITRYD